MDESNRPDQTHSTLRVALILFTHTASHLMEVDCSPFLTARGEEKELKLRFKVQNRMSGNVGKGFCQLCGI